MRFAIELDFLNRFRRKKPKGEQRHGINVTSPFVGVFGRTTKSGVGVTEEGALGLSSVYAAISKIATTLASLPLNLHRVTDNGKTLDKSHPAFVLLNSEPNDRETTFTFIERMVSDALMYGCAYALIERGVQSNRPVNLHTLNPANIRSDVHEGTRVYRDQETGTVYFGDDLIILEAFRGKSPIRLHMENMGITAAAMEYGARFFGTGGNVGGFLMTDKSLTDEQYHRLKNTWSAQIAFSGLHLVPNGN